MNVREAFRNVRLRAVQELTSFTRELPQGALCPLSALTPSRQAGEALHAVTQASPTLGAQAVLGVPVAA